MFFTASPTAWATLPASIAAWFIYDGANWTDMDIEDLKAAIEAGASIQDAAVSLTFR